MNKGKSRMNKFFLIALSAMMTATIAAGCAPTEKAEDRIVYREDFENKTFADLEWSASNVFTDSTADWTIEEGKLIVDNRTKVYNPNPQDSYLIVVPETTMEEVITCEEGFTVQWDFEYYEGGDAKRYITLPLFYNTTFGNSYFSYHYRICGYADFQARIQTGDKEWITLDEEGSEYEGKKYLKANAREYTDESGAVIPYEDVICKRVFGQDYVDSKTMLSINQKATVRIEYHPGQYIRVFMNDVYITTSSANQLTNINQLLSENGGAIALKAGGKIYGAIDNIVVAKGIGIPETTK